MGFMEKRKIALGALFALLVSTVLLSGCLAQEQLAPTITVNQSGGAASQIIECSDRQYITDTADYIVEGTVEKVESKWNEARTQIHTYTSFLVERYTKGDLDAKSILIVRPGGTVGLITESVGDQAILREGKSVRLYIREKTNGEFSIVCGSGGVEEITDAVPEPTEEHRLPPGVEETEETIGG